LAFSKLVPKINYNPEEDWGSPVVAQGGRTWSYHTALRMCVQFSDVDPGALVVTLWKNKRSTSQSLSMLLAVREGRIDDAATVGLLSSVFGIAFESPDDAFDHALSEGVPVPSS